MCADQMCDEHHLSQERTQEAATKTGAAVTSGGTEGLLPLCVSGQKTRTMFKEKGKAKHPARIQEAQEEAGPSGLGRLLLLLGTCPRALPNFSALMFNPRKTEEPDHKAIHACRGMEVAASVVSQKHVGTARRERERAGHSHCRGNSPPCFPPDGQARAHGRGTLRKNPLLRLLNTRQGAFRGRGRPQEEIRYK